MRYRARTAHASRAFSRPAIGNFLRAPIGFSLRSAWGMDLLGGVGQLVEGLADTFAA